MTATMLHANTCNLMHRCRYNHTENDIKIERDGVEVGAAPAPPGQAPLGNLTFSWMRLGGSMEGSPSDMFTGVIAHMFIVPGIVQGAHQSPSGIPGFSMMDLGVLHHTSGAARSECHAPCLRAIFTAVPTLNVPVQNQNPGSRCAVGGSSPSFVP